MPQSMLIKDSLDQWIDVDIYVIIMTGKNCRQFMLLTWKSFIGQFVHPVGVESLG